MAGYETPRCYTLAGQGGVPGGATGVLVNLTAVNHPDDKWLTLYPNGQVVPDTSNLNYDTSEYAIANSAVLKLGTDGKVCVVGSTNTDAIIDVTGYLQ